MTAENKYQCQQQPNQLLLKTNINAGKMWINDYSKQTTKLTIAKKQTSILTTHKWMIANNKCQSYEQKKVSKVSTAKF